ncbi:MAG: hypothetical protein ACRCVV_13660, partial [Shewanella sp.]
MIDKQMQNSAAVTNAVVKNTVTKRVAVVGCGWFGLALAKQLLQEGYKVNGSKRRPEDLAVLTELGIDAFALNLTQETQIEPNEPCRAEKWGLQVAGANSSSLANYSLAEAQSVAGLLQTDFLVVNIPPRLQRGHDVYLQELSQLLALIQGWQYQGIVFISSTGVYPAKDRSVAESDALALTPENQTLLTAEALFAQQKNSCIVRFAGLVGPKRHPGRFLAGKTDVPGANVAVNLVHLCDCVRAVSMIVAAQAADRALAPIYNLCAPLHPSKGEFYQAAAQSLGLVPPVFNQQVLPNKVVLAQAIVADLGF